MTAPATCSELWKQDITRDQEVFLDPDGLNNGEKPVKAFCTFPRNNVTFGEENHINITHCEDADGDYPIDHIGELIGKLWLRILNIKLNYMLLPKFRHFEGQNFKNRMSISKTLSINNGKNLYLRKRM